MSTDTIAGIQLATVNFWHETEEAHFKLELQIRFGERRDCGKKRINSYYLLLNWRHGQEGCTRFNGSEDGSAEMQFSLSTLRMNVYSVIFTLAARLIKIFLHE
jgi:hypothetical protein